MAANKKINIAPIALSATLTTNLLNPPTVTGGVNAPAGSTATYYLIRKIRIVNKTAGAVTFSLYKGATGANAAGTEVFGTLSSVPANSYVEYNGELRMDTADFLVGGASAGTSLVMQVEGEIGIAG